VENVEASRRVKVERNMLQTIQRRKVNRNGSHLA